MIHRSETGNASRKKQLINFNQVKRGMFNMRGLYWYGMLLKSGRTAYRLTDLIYLSLWVQIFNQQSVVMKGFSAIQRRYRMIQT
jgi:hypothetical protein